MVIMLQSSSGNGDVHVILMCLAVRNLEQKVNLSFCAVRLQSTKIIFLYK
jgi:hypothetical protein